MKFGLGHGPRFHINLFGGRCHWPCIAQANSSISSNSTNSSLLDNNYTNSWTYIQYGGNTQGGSSNTQGGSSNNSSTFNDVELISLINEGIVNQQNQNQEEVVLPRNDNFDNQESGAATPWANNANGYDRHARRDVRTLFPESDLFSGGGAASVGAEAEIQNAHECQYVNFPLVAAAASANGTSSSRDFLPFYASSRGSNNSSNSSLRQSLSELFEFDATQEDNDWATGGDHPYGIPSSLLGGVLLNLDNQLRLSSSSEWQNWSEFLTAERENGTGLVNQNSEMYDNISGAGSNRNSEPSSGGSAEGSLCNNDVNNSLNDENTTSGDNNTGEDGDVTNGILPSNVSAALPERGFLNRHFALPPPPSSNSSNSTRSSGSGSTSGRPRQSEWYFYDPRLVPEQRTQRVTLDTSFRGLHNRCHMSSIIQPPAYDDIVNNDLGDAAASGEPLPELPPPYSESEPPPSYDQSFGHSLAFPTFQPTFLLGSLPVSPLERRLAASLCMSPIVMSAPQPELDILTDVNIDELLDGPAESNDNTATEVITDDLPLTEQPPLANSEDSDTQPMEQGTTSEEEEDDFMDNDLDLMEAGPDDGEQDNSQFSLRRYPVGFCLGRRPPLRWSRGMAPNRWASTENWGAN